MPVLQNPNIQPAPIRRALAHTPCHKKRASQSQSCPLSHKKEERSSLRMTIRHRPSPPPSPRLGSSMPLLGGAYHAIVNGSDTKGRRLPLKNRLLWQARVKYLGIALVSCLVLVLVYSAELRRETRLGDKLKVHRAGWLKTHAVDRVQNQANKLKTHIKDRLLRGRNASEMAQAKEAVKVLDQVIEQEVQDVVDEELQEMEDDEYEDDDEDDDEQDDQEASRSGRMVPEELQFPNKYADRHIKTFIDIVESKMCQNPVVDLSDPAYTVDQAVEIFSKCRLVVLKNAFNVDLMKEYRKQFAEFVQGLKDGRISTEGPNTAGDSMFFAGRNRGRFEVVLPERLAHPGIIANEKILEVARHPKVLGNDFALRSLQSLLAEGNQAGGTPGQEWHFDQGFLFGNQNEGLKNYGIAGHDIPPAVISLGLPLLDMERNIGPTEFCIGSSAMNGVSYDAPVMNETLVEEGSLFDRYFQFDGTYCPAECWVSPLLNLGDAALWEYGVRHRGGWNSSPYLRSIALLIYAKRWYDDVNFGDKVRRHPPVGESPVVTDLLSRTRMALPNKDEAPKEPVTTHLENIVNIYPPMARLSPFEVNRDEVDFIVSNYDVEGNPTLYMNGVSQGPLPSGESKLVSGTFGDVMQLRVGSEVVGQFTCSDQGQFVFTKDATW